MAQTGGVIYPGLYVLLDAVTAIGAGESVTLPSGNKTCQLWVTGEGPVSATVLIQVSNVVGEWLPLAAIELEGEDTASDGLVWVVSWKYCRANCTALSEGAVLTVNVGSAQ